QRGFTLSVDVFNPNAWHYDNIPVNFTASLSDRFGNVGPETQIVFSSERGGRIDGSCTTSSDAGRCSVGLLSQPGAANSPLLTVTALSEGEGDFKDSNGDGLFDHIQDGNTDHGSGGAIGCDLSQES